MYEVFAIISDELGTRTIPTGDGALSQSTAENFMMRHMIENPETRFFVDFVPSEDYFHAY